MMPSSSTTGGMVTTWNPAAEKITVTGAEEMVGSR
jgi:hypothetical protein